MSKFWSCFFFAFYLVLIWAVFTMHTMFAMQLMAIGMLLEATIGLVHAFRPR
ncbi:hypothetical protein [Secundilactobacillus paracollinoides]|uniref:hypothetical protein n=1 Tax=Secundilactobacillus paracollinoides TaxID=240427 RepID=UPI0006F06910|nr:hypothetical protein [Secundilactobacillus paracollinoides]KRL76774.1 hypothetical protein FC17_GL001590 [Secundilactobacillus paracollinoides DSM 15502 = JCM 11969]